MLDLPCPHIPGSPAVFHRTLLGLLLVSVNLPAAAQQHDPSVHERHMRQLAGSDSSTRPYVELADRTIKALSADDVRGLQAGEGMGFALAAELNGFPGPKHVLEMAEGLELTADQRAATKRIFDEMAEAARGLGAQLVEAEQRLDDAFAGGSIDAEQLNRLTALAAETRGQLRAAHLLAHLAMIEVLSEEQIQSYSELRGYRP